MNIAVYKNADLANAAATDRLASWLVHSTTRNVMLAAGNTPLELYRRIAERTLPLAHLEVFALDEYLGVPVEEPRNCANLLRSAAGDPWKIPSARFHTVSSDEIHALRSVQEHERRIASQGGLDVVVLGLGQNGHLGFNEPGSLPDSVGRLIDLQPSSVEANREWFGSDYAPSRGVTVGLRTILAARQLMIMAYGSHKTTAVKAMLQGPMAVQCPASFLQAHANAWVFLDQPAAGEVATRA